MRELQKELRRKAKLAEIRDKDEAEKKLTRGNAREAWQGKQTGSGCCPDSASLAEHLNIFSTCFNSTISPITRTPPTLSLPTEALNISEHLVTSVLSQPQ